MCQFSDKCFIELCSQTIFRAITIIKIVPFNTSSNLHHDEQFKVNYNFAVMLNCVKIMWGEIIVRVENRLMAVTWVASPRFKMMSLLGTTKKAQRWEGMSPSTFEEFSTCLASKVVEAAREVNIEEDGDKRHDPHQMVSKLINMFWHSSKKWIHYIQFSILIHVTT